VGWGRYFTRYIGRLHERHHAELRGAPIKSFTASACLFEAFKRPAQRDRWVAIMARNEWFQTKCIAALKKSLGRGGRKPVIFAYSYAARRILRAAKELGCATVLGQIDPGPREEDIVSAEAQNQPQLTPTCDRAPSLYWEHWRAECEYADTIIVNSDWSKTCLASVGVADSKLITIPLAYEPSSCCTEQRRYPPAFTLARPMRVLFLGQINLRKGIAYLLRTAETMANLPIEFWMVGPVQVRGAPSILELPNVRWFGPVKNSRISSFYHAADVFVLPTLSDGFALTQLEAMSHRLPVIASSFCGSVVCHGKNGFVLPEVSSATIADALQHLLTSPKLLREFSAASIVRKEFSLEALASNLQQLP
jgi:glycosyltransferase involved in cell wall biosynthesis